MVGSDRALQRFSVRWALLLLSQMSITQAFLSNAHPTICGLLI